MYYLLDKKYDQTYTVNFIGSESFNMGDKLFLTMPECIKGVTKISSFNDTINGETDLSYLKKFFRYKNGNNNEWSDTIPIEQITSIDICSKKCLQLEIIYFRLDDGGVELSGNTIVVSNISIGGEYELTSSDSQIILKPSDNLQILEVGDLLKIFSIDAFEVISTAKYGNEFMIKFRYSQDGKLSWTKWEPLTKENISSIHWDKTRFVELQYLFELETNYNKDIKIYEVILYGDFQNVTSNYKKINKFGLKENCVNLAFKTSSINDQISELNDYNTVSVKTPNSTTQSLITESSEYQLRMNYITQGLNCYSNPTNSSVQIDQLNVENSNNKSNFWNPYEFTKIVDFQNMLAQQLSQMLGMTVEYHLTDPDGNGIDKVIHEQQLFNIIDYKTLKVLVPDNQFPESQIIINQFNLDLFDTFKIHILKEDFKNAFGIGKRPSQEDIIYFCQVNRMYIIKHAQIHKNVMNAGIYYDVVLEKYEKRANVINRIEESKDRIEQLTRNTTIDELFGFEEQNDFTKVSNKIQQKPKSFDFIRSEINSRTNIIKYPLYNGQTLVMESYYDLSNVKKDENAIQYIKADNNVLKSDNRSFVVWFKFPNEYKEGGAITKRVIGGYEVDDDKYYFINNYDNGKQLGYSLFYQTDNIYLLFNNKIYKMSIDVMTNVWFALIVNLDQRQMVVDMKLYRRNTTIDVVLFQPNTYDKLELNMDTEYDEIEYEMSVNGFRAVDNKEITSVDITDSTFILVNSANINNIEPLEFTHELNITIPGSNMMLSNIRIFNDLIESGKEQWVLNQLIVKDAQHLIVGDNANNKLSTTNFPNKQWR